MNNSSINKDEYLTILKSWQESGGIMPEPEILTHILNACNEVVHSF